MVCMLHGCCVTGNHVVPEVEGVEGSDHEVPHVISSQLGSTVAKDGRHMTVPEACMGQWHARDS